MLRIFNYGNRFAPPGKTVVQVELETEWDYWHDLQRDNRAGYEAEKERLAAEILKRLGKYYPGISAQVEMTDVATPTPPGAAPATAAALRCSYYATATGSRSLPLRHKYTGSRPPQNMGG